MQAAHDQRQLEHLILALILQHLGHMLSYPLFCSAPRLLLSLLPHVYQVRAQQYAPKLCSLVLKIPIEGSWGYRAVVMGESLLSLDSLTQKLVEFCHRESYPTCNHHGGGPNPCLSSQ